MISTIISLGIWGGFGYGFFYQFSLSFNLTVTSKNLLNAYCHHWMISDFVI